MSKPKNEKLIKIVQLSVLIALLIIFSFTGLGYLKFGVIEITLNVIPVAIGAIVLGPTAGTVCGAVFGLTSFIQCFGMSAFGVALFNISPIRTFILCFFPRLFEGLFTALIFNLFKKNKNIGYAVSSLLCPLFNTSLFIGTLILLFRKSEYFISLFTQSGANNIISFIAWFAGINGIVEIIACFIVSATVSKILVETNKKLI